MTRVGTTGSRQRGRTVLWMWAAYCAVAWAMSTSLVPAEASQLDGPRAASLAPPYVDGVQSDDCSAPSERRVPIPVPAGLD